MVGQRSPHCKCVLVQTVCFSLSLLDASVSIVYPLYVLRLTNSMHQTTTVTTTGPPFPNHGNPCAVMEMVMCPFWLLWVTCCASLESWWHNFGGKRVTSRAVTQKQGFLGLGYQWVFISGQMCLRLYVSYNVVSSFGTHLATNRTCLKLECALCPGFCFAFSSDLSLNRHSYCEHLKSGIFPVHLYCPQLVPEGWECSRCGRSVSLLSLHSCSICIIPDCSTMRASHIFTWLVNSYIGWSWWGLWSVKGHLKFANFKHVFCHVFYYIDILCDSSLVISLIHTVTTIHCDRSLDHIN